MRDEGKNKLSIPVSLKKYIIKWENYKDTNDKFCHLCLCSFLSFFLSHTYNHHLTIYNMTGLYPPSFSPWSRSTTPVMTPCPRDLGAPDTTPSAGRDLPSLTPSHLPPSHPTPKV